MNFELSEEFVAIQDMTCAFLTGNWHGDRMRDALDKTPATVPTGLWQEMAQMGWLNVAESMGDEALLVSALIAQECGRALFPATLNTALAASYALNAASPSPRCDLLLRQLTTGSCRISLAFDELNGNWGLDCLKLGLNNVGDGSYTLTGTKVMVIDGASADLFLVAVHSGSELVFAAISREAEGLTINAMQRFDGADIVELVFDTVRVSVEDLITGPSLVATSYDFTTVLLAADLIGTAEAALDMTNEYAKQREQFGRAIGSFQAVSHRLAELLVNVEIARSLLYAACLALGERRGEGIALVSAVKSWCNELAVDAGEAAIQLHGGIGYTWELDAHLYLRRARSNAMTLGDSDYHRARVAHHMATQFTECGQGIGGGEREL